MMRTISPTAIHHAARRFCRGGSGLLPVGRLLLNQLALAPLLLCLTGLVTTVPAWAQEQPQVQAMVDRQLMGMGETFKLTLEVKNTRSVEQPDLTALTKDFQVLGTNTQTSMKLVNGSTSRSIAYVVTLEPKRRGQLTIPPLKVAGMLTEPITVTVADVQSPDQAGEESVFIEVDAEPAAGTEVYVQSQISLVVKLFYPNTLSQGNLEQPDLGDAVVELLDEVKYVGRRGGRHYNVLERRYAIQPERSGELVIPPMRFEGRVASGRRSFFSSRLGRRVAAISDSLRFTVKAQPDSYSGDQWVPARHLELSLQQDKTSVKVGEPVTRRITIRARGLAHTQLPDLPELEIDGGRIYPGEGDAGTSRQGRWMVAQRQYEQAIVPSHSGTLTIPDLEVSWWDVVNDEAKTLVIPGTQIEVLPAATAATDVTPPPAADDEEHIADGPQTHPQTQSPADDLDVRGGNPAWRWGTFIFAGLWLITLGLWWREHRRPRTQGGVTPKVTAPNLKTARREVRQACAANDASAARQALIRWGAALWPQQPPVNLRELARCVDQPQFTAAIDHLSAASYAAQAETWRGDELWAAVAAVPAPSSRSQSAQDDDPAPLPSLYPSR